MSKLYYDKLSRMLNSIEKPREIVIWGFCDRSRQIGEYVKKYGWNPIYVDSNPNKVNGREIKETSFLKGKKDKYFVVIPLTHRTEICDCLEEYGYESKDYFYFSKELLEINDRYRRDDNGNEVIGYIDNIRIRFYGANSHIEIGNSLMIDGNVTIDIFGDNARLSIEENVCVYADMNISMDDDSEVIISDKVRILGGVLVGAGVRASIRVGKGCEFYSSKILTGENARINVGENCSFNEMLELRADSESEIFIGDDCMFGRYINILPCDGHSVFDSKSGCKRNSLHDTKKPWSVYVGKHVWVGQYTTILHPSRIGDGGVVGANSLVKIRTASQKNCLLAGNPAKILSQNIAWCRDGMTEDINDCFK